MASKKMQKMASKVKGSTKPDHAPKDCGGKCVFHAKALKHMKQM